MQKQPPRRGPWTPDDPDYWVVTARSSPPRIVRAAPSTLDSVLEGPLLEGLATPPQRGLPNENLTCYRNASAMVLYASTALLARENPLARWISDSSSPGRAPVETLNRAARIAADLPATTASLAVQDPIGMLTTLFSVFCDVVERSPDREALV